MLVNKQLVYLSLTSWSAFDQRPHHFVRWYHQRTKKPVLWVNSYPTRLPKISDFYRLNKNAQSDVRNDELTIDWLTQVSPKALPVEPIKLLTGINQYLWRRQLEQIQRFISKAETTLVVTKPSRFALEVIKANPNVDLIYDVMDDYASFYTGISKVSMMEIEKQLLKYKPLVLSSCSNLVPRYEALGLSVRKVFNAVPDSIPRFNNHCRQGVRPVLGYVGGVGSWFDWEWLIELANLFPNSDIRIIGPLFEGRPKHLPPNIHFYGPCDHLTAMRHIAQFNVGLIPFKRNTITNAVDPIKYYEYIIQGVPVLSTPFGEMLATHKNELGVFLADCGSLRLSAISALRCKLSSDYVNSFMQVNSWDYRFDSADIISKNTFLN